jgi:hypothetical protein
VGRNITGMDKQADFKARALGYSFNAAPWLVYT